MKFNTSKLASLPAMKLGTWFPVNGSRGVDVRPPMFCWLFLSRYTSGEGYALSSASCWVSDILGPNFLYTHDAPSLSLCT